MDFALVLILGLVAGTVGGIVGFGTSIMVMPALVLVVGPREAVPVMAIASILANASRVLAWWREVDWRATAAFSATAMPAAALGARTLLALPGTLVEVVLGLFFIAMIPIRRRMLARDRRIGLRGMMAVGAGVGFLTGIVASTGPLNTPFFLMHGLAKGAFLGTEAMASIGMYVAKAATFHGFGALPVESVMRGLVVGASMMAGAFIGKRYVLRLDAANFQLLMDGLMLVAGAVMIAAALR